MNGPITRVAAGAAAGFAATAPMTLYMAGVREALPGPEQYDLPPRIVTERAAQKAGVAHHMSEPQKKAATTAAHFAFGAGAGAAYGVVAPVLPFHPVVNGIAYGLGVWASSYLGWLPAAGLHPPAHRESTGRNVLHAGAHVVWGAVVGLLTEQLAGNGESSEVQLPQEPPAILATGG